MEPIFTEIPWAVILILLPLAGGVIAFLFPEKGRIIGPITSLIMVLSVLGLGWTLHKEGVYRHAVGGWGAPLGIEFYADGFSLLLLTTAALVGLGITLYSAGYFNREVSNRFWSLWLFLNGGLNALFLSADVFNLYVTMELTGLAAVALAALSGTKDALSGSMRYLLATLLGSLAYLLGVAFFYHGFGTVDLSLLQSRVEPSPVVWAGFALMGVGLALKTALFPLHFWLPHAHANAPAPVSAVLSALVVKTSFYIFFRLWVVFFGALEFGIGNVFGLLGAGAILWGSFQALRQTRLKLLIAYSTVAQVGYLFLVFPLADSGSGAAWEGVSYLLVSHALSKAALFMAAGNLHRFGGHDRIADLDRVVQRLPLTVGAFALAGVSLIGLPPSGGFIGKWLLLKTALMQGRWDFAGVIILGGLLAAGYVFKVLGPAFTQAEISQEPKAVSPMMEWSALGLAFGAIVLGFLAPLVLSFIGIGNPFGLSEVLP